MSIVLKTLISEEINKAFKLLSEGIIHIDKLKPDDLLNFLKNWNLDKAKFHVSEKMDGNYMALGVQDGEFYLRSKSRIFNSSNDVPNIFFMNDFKRYFQLLSAIPWNKIISKMSNKWNFNFNGNFEIEGEAIPSFDHNIVVYDEAKIGDGVFVIFNTKSGLGKDKTGRLHNPKMWIDLAKEINKYGPVKFFSVPEVDLSDLEFDNDLIVDLEALIEEHGNFLSKPARTPGAKELKTKVLDRVAQLGYAAKQKALQHPVQSTFGPEVEGVVISSPDGKLVKIVDTSKFTARKETNWHFINQLIDAERDFKRKIKELPKNLDQHLEDWRKSVTNVQKDFDENAHEHITINKKIEDTQNGIDYALSLIEQMSDRLKAGDFAEDIVSDFNERKIIPEIKFALTEAVLFSGREINEGGKVFQDQNSVVPKPLLEPSIDNALKLANLENIKFEIVGNKHKNFFSDIDIAVDSEELIKYLGLPLAEVDFWNELNDYLAKSKVEKYSIIKGLKQFHVLVPLVDSSGKNVRTFLPDGSRGTDPAMIQIDIFVGNLGWMKDINSGAPETSKYKAIYRNMLLASIASIVRWETETNENNEYYRYVMNFRDGLKRQKIKFVSPSTEQKKLKLEKISDEIITAEPDDLAKILFGDDVKWADINSFEEIYKLLISPKFKFKKFLSGILSDFKTNLIKRNIKIPIELSN